MIYERAALRQLLDDLNASLDRLGEALAVPEDRPLASKTTRNLVADRRRR
jgi:hypothetical protein